MLALVALILLGVPRHAAVVPPGRRRPRTTRPRSTRRRRAPSTSRPSAAGSSTPTGGSWPTTSAVLTVTVDWSVDPQERRTATRCSSGCPGRCRRRSTSSAALRPVLRRAGDPVQQGQIYDPLLPLPLKEDVDEDDGAASCSSAARTIPGVDVIEEWKRVYPYAPLASHVVGYMGAITADTLDELPGAGYNATSASASSASRRAWSRAARHVGQAGVRDRRRRQHRRRLDRGDRAGRRQGHPAEHRPRRPAVRRAGAARPSCATAATCRPTRTRAASPTGRRRTTRSTRRRTSSARATPARRSSAPRVDPVQGAGRVGGGAEPQQRSDPRDGQLPDVRQPVVQTRHQQGEVRPAVPRTTGRSRTSRSSSTARCRASTTSARRSSRSSRGRRCTPAIITPTTSTTTRASTSWSRSTRRLPAQRRQCAASSRTPRHAAPASPADVRPGVGRGGAGRVQRRVLLPDRREVLPAPTPRRTSRSMKSNLERSASAPRPASSCRTSATAGSPTTTVKKALVKTRQVLARARCPSSSSATTCRWPSARA